MDIFSGKKKILVWIGAFALILGIGFTFYYKNSPWAEAACGSDEPVFPDKEFFGDYSLPNHGGKVLHAGNAKKHHALSKNDGRPNRVCFLVFMDINNVDDANELVQCELRDNVNIGTCTNNDWCLSAKAYGEYVDVSCSAACLCWDPVDDPGYCARTRGDPL